MYLGRSLGNVNLSPVQKEIVRRGSQIYKLETLERLYGKERAKKEFDITTRNLLLMLGKGSGKDFVSKITCSYIVHKLLCLKDPSGYYGKPSDESIDIVNMALNADQAFRVFFNPLKKYLTKSPWFSERMAGQPHAKDIEFNKSVFLYSLHSDPEAAEGLNIIAAVLDEIDGFNTEDSQEMYDYLKATVVSRFPKFGKVLCLSFPRSKDGWMMTQYDAVVQQKDVETYEHVFKLNNELEDGIEDNEFTVHWDEDTVVSYKQDNWFALKAPTFRVNPAVNIEDYRDSFYADREANTSETLLRVCANPPDHTEATFFRNQKMVQEAFDRENGWDEKTETILCKVEEGKEYFIHVDLSKVSDRTVVAMGHVSKWVEIRIGDSVEGDVKPHIIIDLFRVWEPNRNKHVDNAEVAEFILSLAKKFNVQLVTFDRWGSIDMIKYMEDRGIESRKQSLDRAAYEEFKYTVQDGRIEGPYDKRFEKELKHLIITKTGKVDHPDGKEHYNDISEAVCGVINNCVANALEELDVQIITKTSVKQETLQQTARHATLYQEKMAPSNDLADFLNDINFV